MLEYHTSHITARGQLPNAQRQPRPWYLNSARALPRGYLTTWALFARPPTPNAETNQAEQRPYRNAGRLGHSRGDLIQLKPVQHDN